MRQKIRSSFRLRFTLTIVLVILIPVLLTLAYLTYRGSQTIQTSAKEVLANQAGSLSQSVTAYDQASTLALDNMSRQPSITSMDPALQEPALVNMAEVYSTMYLILTTDLEGTNVARSDGGEPLNYADRAWFQAAAAGEDVYRQSVVSRTTGEPVVGYSLPIRQGEEVVGVAFVGTDLTTLAEVVGAIQIGESGFAYVVDADGNVLAHPDPAMSSDELVNISDYAPVAYALGENAGAYSFIDEEGVDWLANTQPVGNGWHVIVQQPRAEALAALPGFIMLAAVFTTLIVGLIGFLTYIAAGRAIRPIEKLTVAATAVSSGNLNESVQTNRADEIGTLATAFNSMTLQLRDLVNNLETRISARTEDLNLAAEIGRHVSQARNLDDVLNEAVTSIQKQFDLYQAQIYLTDAQQENLILRASDGHAGSRLLEVSHQLPINKDSLNGSAAYDKQAVIVADTQESDTFRPHPLLPDTRSEMVVPLIVDEVVLGTIDFQSTEANTLTEDILPALTVLAGQLAIAILNARQNRTLVESQTLLRTIIDASPDWIFLKDQEYRYQLVNQAYANYFNLSPEAFVDKNDLDLGFPEESVKGNPEKGIRGFWADDKEVFDSGEMKQFPEELSEFDGKSLVLQTTKTPVIDADGNTTGVVGFVHDITNRKKAENTIARRADELLTVAKLSTAVAASSNPQQLLQEIVDLAKERFNFYHTHIYLLDEAGENLVLAAGAGDVGKIMVAEGRSIPLTQKQSLVARAARTKEGVIVNNVILNPEFLPNPLLFDTRSEMAVPMIAGNHVLGVLDVQSDVAGYFSEQDVQIQTTLAAQTAVALQNARQYEQTQEALAQSNMFRQLADASSQGVSITSLQGEPLYSNQTLAKILQIENIDKVVSAKTLVDFYPAEVQIRFQEEIIPSLLEQGSWQGELWLGDPHQPTFTYENHFLLRDDEGQPTHAAAVISDITERKQVEESIQANETLMRTIIDTSPDQIIVKSKENRFILVNQAFVNITKMPVDEIIGKNDIEIGTDEELVMGNPEKGIIGYWNEDQAVITSGKPIVIENVFDITYSNKVIKVPLRDRDGNVTGLVVFIQDITSQKNAELEQKELVQALEEQFAQVNALQRAMTGEGWTTFLENSDRGATGFAFTGKTVSRFNDISQQEAIGNVGINLNEVSEISYGEGETAVALPLQISGEAIGVIGARTTDGTPLNAEQKALLTTLTQQVAESLERARLFEETEIARSQTEALFTGSENVVRSTSMSSILTALVEATALKNMDRATLLFFNRAWQDTIPESSIVAATWQNENQPRLVDVGTTYFHDAYPLFQFLRKDTPTIIEDFNTFPNLDENSRRLFVEGLGLRTAITVPLVVGEQWLGFVLGLSSTVHRINESELRQITSLTSQAATVAQSQRLYQEADSRAEREQILRLVSDRVYAAPDAETVLRTAAREIGQALGLETFIYLEDPEAEVSPSAPEMQEMR